MAKGTIVITRNKRHTSITPLGIGKGLRTKINANIGTSKDRMSMDDEIEKLKVAVAAGADAVMDLSTGGPIIEIRNEILRHSTVSIGTVPIYQAAVETVEQGQAHRPDGPGNAVPRDRGAGRRRRGFRDRALRRDAVEHGAAEAPGQDHGRGEPGRRVPSRMDASVNEKENPLYTQYDRLIEICKKYDMTLSLGDGMRPGCLADATDRAQIEELITLGELRDQSHTRQACR